MHPPYCIHESPGALRVELGPELTVEHARQLHQDLVERLPGRTTLALDAGRVVRLDAAILQLIWAAAQAVPAARLSAGSEGWQAALRRHGLTWPDRPSPTP